MCYTCPENWQIVFLLLSCILMFRFRYWWLRLRVIPRDEAAENSTRADAAGAGEFGQERRWCQERWDPHQNQKHGFAKGKKHLAVKFSRCFLVIAALLDLLSSPQVSGELLSSKESPTSRKSSSSPKHKGAAKGAGSGKKEKKSSVAVAVPETTR